MISLGGLMAAGSIHSAYQPIIDLASGAPVAYEALLRGPPGSDAEFPARLFELAEAQGLQEELEWAGLEHGVTGALRAGMDRHTTLFVNVEGSARGVHAAPRRWRCWRPPENTCAWFLKSPNEICWPGRGICCWRPMNFRSVGGVWPSVTWVCIIPKGWPPCRWSDPMW
ncbi:hypothetical protein BH24ACT15_BH24ACT15_03560 [soil metagenome]